MPPKLNAHFLCYESQFNFQEIPQFVGGVRYNTLMTTKWNKYTYVCNTCDGLFEMTIQATRTIDQELCPSCFNTMTNLSVVDATIYPSTTTKEETMSIIDETPIAVQELQIQLDLAKSALQMHQNCDYWKSENGRIGSQLIALINDAYENESDASDILEAVCEIIDYNPVKTVQFEGVIHFSGSIDIPMNEVADFDLTSALEDVYVDINNGNVIIDNYELYSVEEPY